MNLTIVPSTHIDQVWPVVGPMLEKACGEKAAAGEFTIDQIRMAIVQRDRHLIVVHDEDHVVGAATIEFINYPNKRVALVSALGGKGVLSKQVTDDVKTWCKSMGASELRAYAKDAQSRLFARFGLGKIYEVLGASL